MTTLMHAAQNDNAHVVSLLLSMGVLPGRVAASGKSAFDYAVSDEVRSILQNARPFDEQLELNKRLIDAAADGDTAAVKEVLAHGGDRVPGGEGALAH